MTGFVSQHGLCSLMLTQEVYNDSALATLIGGCELAVKIL
jgi:hypothetical protein